MAIHNNTGRSLNIASRQSGVPDGAAGGIIDRGNLEPEWDNRNGWVGLPDGNKPVRQQGMPELDPVDIPEIKKPSNPYPGFGGTEG